MTAGQWSLGTHETPGEGRLSMESPECPSSQPFAHVALGLRPGPETPTRTANYGHSRLKTSSQLPPPTAHPTPTPSRPTPTVVSVALHTRHGPSPSQVLPPSTRISSPYLFHSPLPLSPFHATNDVPTPAAVARHSNGGRARHMTMSVLHPRHTVSTMPSPRRLPPHPPTHCCVPARRRAAGTF